MEQMDPAGPQNPEISSFGTRAVNVLSSPGELFAEVADAPVQGSSWIIPYMVMALLFVLMMFSMTNNPVLFDQMKEQQRDDIRSRVEEGSMSRAEADRASEIYENQKLVMAVSAGFGIIIVTAAYFGIPFILRLCAKGLWKSGGTYKKTLEIYGLSSVIGIVGLLVTMLMMNLMNSLYAQPGGAYFLMDSFDSKDFGHNVLASLNLFTVWQVAVVGIGLSAVARKSAGQGMMLSFGLWIVWVIVAGLLGWGAR